MWYGFAMKNEFVQNGNETAPLPMSRREMKARGIEQLDFVYIIGDAYIDHPSFGPAIISRVLESHGYTVGIISQPDWHDAEAFRALGRPKLGFLISSGNMDSMVNHYTSAKKRRSEDAYTEGGVAGRRPDRAVIVYSNRCREAYKNVPVIIGGIEASLRRFAHYDYWDDKVRRSVLCDSGADLLLYGMGERSIVETADALSGGLDIKDITYIAGSCYMTSSLERVYDYELIESYEDVAADRKKYASAFMKQYREQDAIRGKRLVQPHGNAYIVVNPPSMPLSEEELDAVYDLPYTRLPHPKYKGKVIPAFEMIKFSVNIHRGCFGGCAFCTISAHQGKFIASRSKESILKEVKAITEMPDFKGYLSDLGGPSANMYRMKGKDERICAKCKKPSCISPVVCKNLNADHTPLLDIYKAVDRLPEIKKSFIGSGVRYDLLLHRYADESLNKAAQTYTEELIARHVSGRLKVAPEHTQDEVLKQMRKPSFSQFGQFKKIFDKVNRQYGLNQQLIPYFISSHPGCTEADMAELAVITKSLHFQLEQVQDFTPTPMTLATEMYYTGYHPYTLEKVYTARSKEQKLAQRQFFFWYKPESRRQIMQVLQKMGRKDLIEKLFGQRGDMNPAPRKRR